MKTTLLSFFLFSLCMLLHGQSSDIDLSNSIYVKQDGFILVAELYSLSKSKKELKKVDDIKYYYWYKSQRIHTTKGGYSGKLLDGPFESFYNTQNLKEKGAFKKGLKIGEWKSWYDNGEIKTIVLWKKGLKEGTFIEFDEKGNRTRKGKYKKSEVKGVVKKYTNGKVEKIKYQEGKEIKKEALTKKISTKMKEQKSKKEERKAKKEERKLEKQEEEKIIK